MGVRRHAATTCHRSAAELREESTAVTTTTTTATTTTTTAAAAVGHVAAHVADAHQPTDRHAPGHQAPGTLEKGDIVVMGREAGRP